MKHLSPMDAQRRLSYARKHGIHMSAEHRRAMETIAAMREEWGVKWDNPGGDIEPYSWGFDTRRTAERWERCSVEVGGESGRIVRRYVTEPEEA